MDIFSFPADTLVADCAEELYGDMVNSLRDEDGYYDVHDVDHYGMQLDSDVNRQVEILAAYAEDATRFLPGP